MDILLLAGKIPVLICWAKKALYQTRMEAFLMFLNKVLSQVNIILCDHES